MAPAAYGIAPNESAITLLLLGGAGSASALLHLVGGGGGARVVLHLALHLVLVAALPASAVGVASGLLLVILCPFNMHIPHVR